MIARHIGFALAGGLMFGASAMAAAKFQLWAQRRIALFLGIQPTFTRHAELIVWAVVAGSAALAGALITWSAA